MTIPSTSEKREKYRDGLRIHDVKVLSVERKESSGRNPSVVVASVETCEQKDKITKNKKKLRQTREYKKMYTEDELSKEAQVNQINMMAILKGMRRDRDFVFVNGEIKNKGNTRRRNGKDRIHEQSERNDRNKWRTVRGRNVVEVDEARVDIS
ncbi:unnamed protein product [Mytilus coruscus]|uniref:Uncharacterized protein n=1 Tax=Mytilus coruscus TaxID=42192 RepID=A0A6J8DQE1_MYTCO|nr:unnamed protein product [Mytilus coruscus]